MPIYEYECTACGERFEIKQKFSDPPVSTCKEFSCPKGEPVKKIISAPAIMFKGSGWYVTDYSDKLKEPKKSDSDGKPAEKKEGAKTTTPSSGETKTKAGEGGAGASGSESGSSQSSSPSTSSGNSVSSTPS